MASFAWESPRSSVVTPNARTARYCWFVGWWIVWKTTMAVWNRSDCGGEAEFGFCCAK
jgi:hypothetical protein